MEDIKLIYREFMIDTSIVEIDILSALSGIDNYNKYKDLLNYNILSLQTKIILKDYEVYFNDYDQVDWNVFWVFFTTIRHPHFDNNTIKLYEDIFNRINQSQQQKDISIQNLIDKFEQQIFYKQLEEMLRKDATFDQVKDIISEYDIQHNKIAKKEFLEDMDLDLALDFTDRTRGLKWHCSALQKFFGDGGLIKSDFGIIAASVDAGKTSFIIDNAQWFARQLKGDDYVLILSNEGDWKSILPRAYCAALNITIEDLTNKRKYAKVKYKEIMGGNKNRLQIKDIQGWNTKDIEQLLRHKTPSLLIIDLLDHVRGFEGYNAKDSGSTERYNQLYQWGREIANKYCPVLGVSQLNGDGYDHMYPKMTELRGSRVDKQAAATFLLTIGSLENNGTTKFLSMPKNKINSTKGWQVSVQFIPEKCRFI